MIRFKKILFFADSSPGENSALNRALLLAENNGASVTVMDVVAEIGTNDTDPGVKRAIKKIQDNLIRARKDVLDQMVKKATKNLKRPIVRTVAIPGEDIAVINLVNEKKFDLIVKSANKKTALGAIFGHIDIRLMRKCPCPVWIIKPSRRRKFRSILAAVDPVPSQESSSLNKSILDIAGSLAEQEDAELHVLHAWELSSESSIRGSLEKERFKELERSIKEDSERKLEKLLDDFSHLKMQDHLVKGKPDEVVNSFVKKHDIDLLVMGTVARTGIPGFFIGNTAEKVLNSVDCSVLTLKPEGFTAS
ncbi:MAG: universal stress protein [bacterium]|nr:hypothetical protein [Gammaproteobacteria bacterium]HIL96149.1 hypothetical protein [Pseudomonadales bacterium]